MESSVASRLKTYMEYTGLNNSQFADACNIPRPSLSQILTGRNKKISNQVLEQLHSSFPDLNILWLVFGEGAMTTGDSPQPKKSAENGFENPFFTGIPTDSEKERTLEGLEYGLSTPQNLNQQEFADDLQFKDLILQIENLRKEVDGLRKKSRKVASITVYYDDNTFESFFPK